MEREFDADTVDAIPFTPVNSADISEAQGMRITTIQRSDDGSAKPERVEGIGASIARPVTRRRPQPGETIADLPVPTPPLRGTSNPAAASPATSSAPSGNRPVLNAPVPPQPPRPTGAKTRFQAVKDKLPTDRHAALEELRNETGAGEDDGLWRIVSALSFAEAFAVEYPSKLKAASQEVVNEAVKSLGAALGKVDSESLATAVTEKVVGKVDASFGSRIRVKWAAVGVGLSLAVFVTGLFTGRELDMGHYREAYFAKVAQLPHAANVLKSPVGLKLLTILDLNNNDALSDIANCSSNAGLSLHRAQGGGAVCAGKGATRGWRAQ